MINQVKLSKTIALALRHKPWLFDLEPDSQGWVATGDLLDSLAAVRPEWVAVSEADLAAMIQDSDKLRYEMKDGRFRALYGHSLKTRIALAPSIPPSALFHGTPGRAVDPIIQGGLRPMSRQYVHLGTTWDHARLVGKRRDADPTVFRVDALAAWNDGIPFYQGNEHVWLADAVPPQYLSIMG